MNRAIKLGLKILSYSGLGIMLASTVLVFQQSVSMEFYKRAMLVGTCTWLLTAPFWINRSTEKQEEDQPVP
ncbi:hypothetical protein [Pontibacter sp. G13]|uniref:hypothetical protein n=1 Tax=Pontibacter sp. G13 TaxID=3074898 RepID=UPI00288A78AD|nr:hypothetical protein [Pontibacter sp. G13]WNJ17703.1 hypothetical protein RJD25_22860 [Pontibacter sp. G13]